MGGGGFHFGRMSAGAAILVGWVLLCGLPAHGQCEVDKLSGPGTGPEDAFGVGLDLGGDVLVVGDIYDSNDIGAAFVFRFDGAAWVQEAVLRAPVPDNDDYFGYAVAVDGDVIVVGAHGASVPEFGRGAVYVFRHDGSEWFYETRLTASDGDAGDKFGKSISIDGPFVLIGAPSDENSGVLPSGSAYVYRHAPRGWVEETKLADPAPNDFEGFGHSVSLHDYTAIVGAPGENSNGVDAGAAFVFHRTGQSWQLAAQLTASDPSPGSWFGNSVGTAAEVALVGCPRVDAGMGSAHVFRRSGLQWTHEARLTAADPVGPDPFFGVRVATDGGADTLLIGAPWDRALGYRAGAAHVFRYLDQNWQEVAKLTSSDGAVDARFGSVLSLDDERAAITGDVGNFGRVYLFAGMAGIDCNTNGTPDACDIFEGTSPDLNANGVPDECETMADLNGDGIVNVQDLLTLLAAWGSCALPCPPPCSGDFNADCVIDHGDLMLLLSSWS